MNNFCDRYKRIFKFSFPIVLSMLSHSIVGMMDTFMVAQLGEVSLASVGLTNVIVNSIIGFLGALAPAVNILIAKELGKDNNSGVSCYIWSGFYLSIIVGLVFTIIGVYFTDTIFTFMGAEVAVINIGSDYMKIRFLTTILVLCQFIFSSFFKSIEKTSILLKVGLISNIVNIIGNYLLIFGKLGFPALGVMGAGISTLISCCVVIILYIAFISNKQYSRYFQWDNNLRIYWSYIKSIVRISMPIGVEEFFSFVLVPTIIMMIVTRIGINAMAANEIVLNIISLISIPNYAFAQASMTFVSKVKDSNLYNKITNTVIDIIVCDLFYLIIVSTVLLIFRVKIISLFINNPAIIKLSIGCLLIAVLSQPFDASWKILANSLRALGLQKWVATVSLILNWILYVPISYLLGFNLEIGVLGIFLGQLIFKFVISVLFSLKFRKEMTKSSLIINSINYDGTNN